MRFAILFICSASFVIAHEDDNEITFDRFFGGDREWTFHLHSDIESRYVLEGRDSLDGDSLVTSTFEAAWKAFSVGLWYGKSPDQAYDELQLSTALSWEVNDFSWYFSYTHLRFLENETHDHEVGAGVSWAGLPLKLEWAVDAYFSFEADGAFIETSLHRDFDLMDRLLFSPAIVFGVNQGYVPEGHIGANQIELRLGGEYKLTPSLTLTAHTSYNFAINSDVDRHPDDELLRNFFHAALGFRWKF